MIEEIQLQEFWNWFLQNEDKFFYFERHQEHLLPEALERLQDIHQDLVFEVGPELDGRRELIISANGMKNGFSAVIELVKTAPEMERWSVVPFRQRKSNLDLQIQIDDFVLSPEDIFFIHHIKGDKVDLDLYIADIDPSDEKVYQLTLLILDNVIGEYDVEMKLGGIEIYPLETAQQPEKLLLLKDLPQIIDLYSRTIIN